MLTAQEQWDIIRAEEQKTGRKRKKKTLVEQLDDMGGFGHDPDSEKAILEDLERVDTRSPLKHHEASISECEVSFGESSFWESRKRLFHSWVFQANRPSSWIEEKDLLMYFRFALHRPIMDEMSLQGILQAMNLQLENHMGDVRQPHTRPIGRSRELMFGIDVDHERNVHVSSRLRHVLPRGAAENMDGVREEVLNTDQQDDEDMHQLVRRQLWTVYEHVQNGSVPLETATWHYKDAFNTQGMSDEDLVICLQHFGVPTDHIPTSERNARRGSAHCPFSNGVESVREEIVNIATPDDRERKIVKQLVDYVGLYRSGALQEHEIIPMIHHCLEGLSLDTTLISEILTDLEKDEETAAILMWEDACENYNSPESSGPPVISSSSSSSSEDENEGSKEEQDNPLRAGMISHSLSDEGKDHDTVADSPANGSKFPDEPTIEDMDYQHDIKEHESANSEAMSIDQPPLNTPAVSPGKRLMCSHIDEAWSRTQPPGTPRQKPASLAPAIEESDSQADIESDREPPRDRPDASSRRSSSPDNDMTTGIWGLLMPTKEARKLAYKLNLPQAAIDEQVRSISPRRTKRRRASYAKTIVTFPKSKRKASMALHGETPPKSPKHGDHSDVFAREGEDQETFVFSHFDSDAIRSKDKCQRCLRLPCECVDGSSLRPKAEPECRKCLQQPCMCDRLPQLDETIPAATPGGNPSGDALKVKLADRTRPGTPKQSITLLAYLARVLDYDNVLASIRQFDRLSPDDATLADVRAIQRHIQQGISAGEDIDPTGDDDEEAMHILNVIIESSPPLADFSDKLDREANREDISTSSIDHFYDGVGEGSNLESSLLNSSPGHKHVPAPRSKPVASAAIFPENQSNVANRPVFKANITPLAKGVSPYLSTSTPVSRVPHLDSNSKSDTEDAAHSSRLQAATCPDSSAERDPTRTENHTGSPAGGESSTAGGDPSRAGISSSSPEGSPPSSTAGLSEQVREHPVDTEGDTGYDSFGAPLTRRPYLESRDSGNSEVETGPPPSPTPGARQLHRHVSPPSPKPGAKQLTTSIPPLSPRPSLKGLPKGTSSATPRLGSKKSSTKMNATAQSCLKRPGFESLPVWPPQPGLPEKAGKKWMAMTPRKALEHAKEEAFRQRKSFAFYLEERRAVRARIKKENDLANAKWSDHSFFQSSNALSGSSGTATTPVLNKLFDKYRGTSDS